MISKSLTRRAMLPAVLGWALLVASATAQDYRYNGQTPAPNQPTGYVPRSLSPGAQRPYGNQASQPVPSRASQPSASRYPARVAQNTPVVDASRRAEYITQQPDEHPLMPAIRWARDGLAGVGRIQDYSAIMVKRELVDGKLHGPDYIFLKVRHEPLSAYLCFLEPADVRGQEVIWIEGQNNGKMQAHGTGYQKIFGTVSLDPNGPIAMHGNRYPITEIGLENLVSRMLEVAERETQYGECEVQFFPGAKINGRGCTCIQVMHPVPRRNFIYHMARIFIDDELNVPVRYEGYGWPSRPGEQPVLEEEYTYLNIKLNNGFTDADFDVRNPNYHFTSSGTK